MNRISRFLILIPIVFLLLALTRMPYSYYSTMRMVVSLAALVFMINECVAAFEYKKWERFVLCALFLTAIMLLFNPLVPFGFPRQTWLMLNIGAATLFFVYFVLYDYGEKTKVEDSTRPTAFSNTAQSDGVSKGRQDSSLPSGEARLITKRNEHSDLLRQAFAKAQKRVVIASPFLTQNAIAVEGIEGRISSAVKNGVKIKVICNLNLADRSADKVLALNQCIESLRRSGAEVCDRKIHSKFIVVDSDWFVVGSFNWLSSARDPNSQNAMQEISVHHLGETAARMISELSREYRL